MNRARTQVLLQETDSPQATAIAALRDRCTGAVFAPGDPGWDDARLAFNVAVDQQPAAVVVATEEQDVLAVVAIAHERGLRVAPQATGHNAGPLGSLAGTILLKTSALDAVGIDPIARRARVGCGAVWLQVTAPASEHGLAPLAGSSPDVGVVGYTLGGGMSWLGRRHGLAANHVTAIEVAVPDGRLLRCDRDHHADLFWALRGGGGSFGVVTAMEFDLLPAPAVFAGAMFWPLQDAAEVLRAWRDWTQTAPDMVTTSARMLRIPPLPEIPEPLRGNAFVVIDGAVLATAEEAGDVLAALRALDPVIDTFAMVPPVALSRLHMDPEEPLPVASDHALLGDAPDGVIDALVAAAGADSDCPLTVVELRQLGGALGRPAPDGGAVSCLTGRFALFALGVPADAASGAAIEAALALVRHAVHGHETGAYANFAERPNSDVFAADLLARLRQVKATYDPGDVIHANHAVSPATTDSGSL